MQMTTATNNMLLLDGRTLARQMRLTMAGEVAAIVDTGIRPPGLAVILAGDNAASKVYVANKQKACAETGINSIARLLPANVSATQLQATIAELNEAPDVDGILLQLPIPAHLPKDDALAAIDPAKDVDGFHPVNMGRLALGLPGFVPCTPAGVLKLLQHYDLSPAGRHAVVVGRSEIVGKPLAMLLAGRESNATVTLCHSRTADLKAICLLADFLFVAVGKPNFITADMVAPGAVVVDIGITRGANGLVGDVDFAQVAPKARAITPVPGGIGPMTIAMLLHNTIHAWQQRTGLLPQFWQQSLLENS